MVRVKCGSRGTRPTSLVSGSTPANPSQEATQVSRLELDRGDAEPGWRWPIRALPQPSARGRVNALAGGAGELLDERHARLSGRRPSAILGLAADRGRFSVYGERVPSTSCLARGNPVLLVIEIKTLLHRSRSWFGDWMSRNARSGIARGALRMAPASRWSCAGRPFEVSGGGAARDVAGTCVSGSPETAFATTARPAQRTLACVIMRRSCTA